jgi:hypothetical protein
MNHKFRFLESVYYEDVEYFINGILPNNRYEIVSQSGDGSSRTLIVDEYMLKSIQEYKASKNRTIHSGDHEPPPLPKVFVPKQTECDCGIYYTSAKGIKSAHSDWCRIHKRYW